MKPPLRPDNESQRLAALHRTGMLDTPAESRFDRLTRIARQALGVPIAMVSLVDSERQWFKSCSGLEATETGRDVSFCAHAILQDEIFVIQDALCNPDFSDNPLVTGPPYIRAYAGAPLRSTGGYRVGSLCVIDQQPRRFSEADLQLLRELADCVEAELNHAEIQTLNAQLKRSETRARAVLEGTRIGTWEWNIQTGETVFNERWAEIVGYTLEELAPVSIETWLRLAHPDDLLKSNRLLNEHFEGRSEAYDFRCRMQHKDGHYVWVHDRGKVLERDAKGQPLRMYGTHADITNEVSNLDSIERQNAVLSVLSELALDTGQSDDQRIQRALALGRDYFAMDMGILSEITGGVYSVRWFDATGDSGLEPNQSFPLDQTYCSLLLSGHEVLAIEHMASSRFAKEPCYRHFGLESYIAVPVRIGDRIFGTLNFSSSKPRAQPFSATDRTFMMLLSKWLGSLLERQAEQERLNKLAEHIPGMVYQYRLWPDGRSAFPYTSAGINQIYRVTPESVRSDASEVFDRIHPQDLRTVQSSIELSARTLGPWNDQYRVSTETGDWRWVEGRATAEKLADGSVVWHGYIYDIHDRKTAELALEKSERQLRGLFELSPLGIALHEYDNGRLQDVNDALLSVSGHDRGECLQMRFTDLPAVEEREMVTTALQQMAVSGRYGPLETEFIRRDGSRHPVRLQGLLISGSDGTQMVWSLIEDISQRRRMERLKNEFVSTVSHELRTPLTSISGALSLVAHGSFGALPEQAAKLVNIAHRNSQQLTLLINDLLDIEKLAAGEVTFDRSPQLLATMIDRAVELNQGFADKQRVTLVTEPADPALRVWVAPLRLVQALSNLVSNAIKFSPAGEQVTLATRVMDSNVRIEVRDHGPGVPTEFRDRIFQRFAQADASSTRQIRGTGLGLAITRELIHRMDGEVGFDSVPGQGSTFWLQLPLLSPEESSRA
ncbi:MAG: PAS domain-containing protein [Marinobacter sp.]|uniref:PAS domain-containing protein n=1 Tax=Marinobacter sp. TaxID=50741 RepID=UPI00299F33D2|nr:PAS domain-containing protein [Marinobacter sp.]MDX1634854.1 PAS domain-containing protein [Marinobacter sp.]